MKVTVRLVVALWLVALAVLGVSTYVQVAEERARLAHDLERRAALLGEGLKESVEPAAAKGSRVVIDRLLKKFGRRGQGIAVYDRVGGLVTATPDMALTLPASLSEATEAITAGNVQKGLRSLNGRPVYVYATPLLRDDKPAGALAVFLDASDLHRAELASAGSSTPSGSSCSRSALSLIALAHRAHERHAPAGEDGGLDPGAAARPGHRRRST